ncbi:AraC family transcriptional regulator [Caulobacter sp. FWC26]|nr:AraC family transcriptional regulator [Caulobacter sp. FWC26]
MIHYNIASTPKPDAFTPKRETSRVMSESSAADQVRRAAPTDGRIISGGGAVLVQARYPAHEGRYEGGGLLRLALCLEGAERLTYRCGDMRIEGPWRAGQIVVTPPDAPLESRCDAVATLGLALDPALLGQGVSLQSVERLGLVEDELLSSVMRALWCEAEAHGASSAFFQHGAELVLRRLDELSGRSMVRSVQPRLSPERLSHVLDWVESHLDSDITVGGMAAQAGREISGFARAFKTDIGCTPYAYITRRRMVRAQALLRSGESVARTACACGYANPAQFSIAFRRLIGASPTVWRARSEAR